MANNLKRFYVLSALGLFSCHMIWAQGIVSSAFLDVFRLLAIAKDIIGVKRFIVSRPSAHIARFLSHSHLMNCQQKLQNQRSCRALGPVSTLAHPEIPDDLFHLLKFSNIWVSNRKLFS